MTVDCSQNSGRWSDKIHLEWMRLNYLQNHLPKRIAPRPGARFGDVINDIYIFKESLSSSGGEERVVRPEPPPPHQEPLLTRALSSTGCSVLKEVLPETP